MMKNYVISRQLKEKENVVFLIGSKSIGMYGGFETFVKGLVDRSRENTLFLVSCKKNGEGCMDVRRLRGAKMIGQDEFIYRDSIGFLVPVCDSLKSAQAIQYDIDALKKVISYIEEYEIKNACVYIMACRIGPFLKRYADRIHALGGKVFLNPDGREWKRSKWPVPIRLYWILSERLMVKNSDVIVCDSKCIRKQIERKYHRFKPQTVFIPYGVDLKPTDSPEREDMYKKWLFENHLTGKEYFLVVGRLVPENNYETIIREYMRSATDKQLVIITTFNEKFYHRMKEQYHFDTDTRIHFAKATYNQSLLRRIREGAYGYIHGHEVGGTNPSLLESLCSTKLNLLYNVCFNREVAGDAGLYWNKSAGSLSGLLDEVTVMQEEEVEEFGKKAKNRIRLRYEWETVLDQLDCLWKMH